LKNEVGSNVRLLMVMRFIEKLKFDLNTNLDMSLKDLYLSPNKLDPFVLATKTSFLQRWPQNHGRENKFCLCAKATVIWFGLVKFVLQLNRGKVFRKNVGSNKGCWKHCIFLHMKVCDLHCVLWSGLESQEIGV